MTAARWRAVLLIAVLLIGVTAAALTIRGRSGPTAEPTSVAKPALLLLTSLPLVFGEQFSIEGGGSPALTALESRYQVIPISVTSDADLAKGRLLLMAHPLAQTPENLVALDRWVRDGGKVLLLADPLLEWPSERPLGDPLRPPPMFADTGLLAHWGLRLDAPDEPGPQMRKIGESEIMTASPGALYGKCEMSPDRLIARCRIGKGAATIVADADFLGVQHLDGPIDHNLEGLIKELEALSKSDSHSIRKITDLSTGFGGLSLP